MKIEAARTAMNRKYSALRVLRQDRKTMDITSRFASQFDHERCIPVKQPAEAAGMPFKTLVLTEKVALEIRVFGEQHTATQHHTNPSAQASPRSRHCDRSEVLSHGRT